MTLLNCPICCLQLRELQIAWYIKRFLDLDKQSGYYLFLFFLRCNVGCTNPYILIVCAPNFNLEIENMHKRMKKFY